MAGKLARYFVGSFEVTTTELAELARKKDANPGVVALAEQLGLLKPKQAVEQAKK